jgi:branched-chain amino acid transport system permease protein
MTTITTNDADMAPGLAAETDWRKAVKYGLVAGAALLIVVGIGMFEGFDARKVIDPFISSGYAVLVWVPIVFAYKATQRQVLEGMEAPPVGVANLVAGAVAGAVSGAVLGAFVILASVADLRETFIHISPTVIELLSHGGSAGSGALVMVFGGAVLGAVGGGIHLLGSLPRMVLGSVVATIIAFNFLELVVGDILRSAGLRTVDRFLYEPSRGLSVVGAVILCAIVVALRLALRGSGARVAVRYRAMPDERRTRAAFVGALVALGVSAFLPSIFGTFFNDVLANAGLFVLLALGLNIVIGYAGLLDLGYVAFFAVGSYTTAVLTSPRSPKLAPGMAFFEALPWVLLMALIAGLVIGTPVIRMRGDYLAIVTLGFGEIARIIFQSGWLKGIFGGAQGILQISPLEAGLPTSGINVHFGYVLAAAGLVAAIVGLLRWRDIRSFGDESNSVTNEARDEEVMDRARWLPRLVTSVLGFFLFHRSLSRSTRSVLLMAVGVVAVGAGLAFPAMATWAIVGIDPPAMFRIILVFVAIGAFASWRLRDSRVGRAWMAVREDEQIAQSMGINIVTTKLLAFVMGAMLASFGGALFAVKIGTIFPTSFEIVQSIIILVVVIVGGMGSIRGVALGAVVLIGVLGGPTQPGLLREFGEYKLLIYGVILVWMMLNRPEGLWPEARRAQELHQEEMLQDAWLRSQGGGDEAEAT